MAFFLLQTLAVAMRHQLLQGGSRVAVQDGVDGIVTGYILDLATAEVVLLGQGTNVRLLQLGQHRMPDSHPGLQRRLVELDFVKETAFKSFVHVLGEVGGGDEDAFKSLHFLKDDVLDGVFHLVDRPLCTFLAPANDGVCLIEQEYWNALGVLATTR